MKYWILVFGLLICNIGLRAQEHHFIYIQTENSKPFYIKFQGNVISSSAAGYVIIPQLQSGDYQINIGFPRNEFPEEEFHVSLKENDKGFLLKNFGEKGWSLFNLQSLELIAGVHAAPPRKQQQQYVTNNAFTRLLADVVQDSSLLLDNTPVTAAVAPAKEDAILKKDTSSKKNLVIQQEIPVWNDNPVPGPKNKEKLEQHILPGEKQLHPEKVNTGAVNARRVMKIMSMYDVDGMEFIYVDKVLNDTIRIFVPAGNGFIPQGKDKIIYEPKQGQEDETTTPKFLPGEVKNNISDEMAVEKADKNVLPMDEHGDTTAFGGIHKQNKQNSDELTITPTIWSPEDMKKNRIEDLKETEKEKKMDSVEKTKNEPMSRIIYDPEPVKNEKVNDTVKDVGEVDTENRITVEKIPMVLTSSENKNCKNFATHNDFLELRKKMAIEMEMQAMLDVARKDLRTKCYTTEQVKNLSYLFLTDEGKYRFYDMAYRHVSDQERFFLLEKQLKDVYYINRFKAMVTP